MNFCFWKERPSLISRILNSKQESIPVGYVPTPVGWGWEGGWEGYTIPSDTLPPGYPNPAPRYPTAGYPTPWIPYTLEGTWYQRYPTHGKDM